MATIRTTKIIIGGKEYSSFDQIPPEERDKIKQKISKLTPGQVGKALFKSLGPLMSGRATDIPNNLIHELLGDEGSEQIKVSFGTSTSAPQAPADRANFAALSAVHRRLLSVPEAPLPARRQPGL